MPTRNGLANGLPTEYAPVLRDLCERYDHDIWIDGVGRPFALGIIISADHGILERCADAFCEAWMHLAAIILVGHLQQQTQRQDDVQRSRYGRNIAAKGLATEELR